MMFTRSSPRILALSKSAQKKVSPKASGSKKCGGTSKEGFVERAAWNAELEKSLVDLLFEHNIPPYRAQNGWSPDAWNKMVVEFHKKHEYVKFSKVQIQEKERELKREYKMLKEARKQSGVSWNEKRCMIIAEPAVWDNIIKSFPRAKKFRKKSFPLFDALGELYDDHIAQGTWNITSTQPPQNSDEGEQLSTTVIEEGDPNQPQEKDAILEEDEVLVLDRTEQRQSITTRRSSAPTANQEKEAKRMKKDALEGLVGRYLDVKTKQVEDEATMLAKEKEAAQANDFSIKRCISVLRTMDVTTEEKIKAAEVFNIPNNRETFISFNDDEPKIALIWLRGKMDKF